MKHTAIATGTLTGRGTGRRTGTRAGTRTRQAGPEAVALEVIRSSGFQKGAREAATPDGKSQMRLPLGTWIVDLRPEISFLD